MTAYSAVAPVSYDAATGNSSWAQSLALRNSSLFNVRIARIDYTFTTSTGAVYLNLSRFEGSSISGGVSVTPNPLRQGATPTGVTCRCRMLTITSGGNSQGSAVTVTGTQKLLTNLVGVSGQSATWEPPFDLLVSSGSSVYFATGQANASGTTIWCNNIIVYFEEIQEDWTT